MGISGVKSEASKARGAVNYPLEIRVTNEPGCWRPRVFCPGVQGPGTAHFSLS